MVYFFAPSLLFFNFWPIHNGCCVSESGWSWALGLRALQRGKRDIESGRLTESLSQSLGNYAKERDYLPQWKREEIMVDSSKTSVWHRMIWNTIYLGFKVINV